MSKEIKMSDVFNLPVKEQKIEVYGVDCKPSFTLEEIECYAAHAINNHDRLVEENKRLLDALNNIIGSTNKELVGESGQLFWATTVDSDAIEEAAQLLSELNAQCYTNFNIQLG